MAICRPKAIDDAPSSGRSVAEDGGGETFLPREEWANRGPRALMRGVASPGEESLSAAIAAQAIEAQPSFGQIEPSGAAWFARSDNYSRRTRGGYRAIRTRGRVHRAKKKKPLRRDGRLSCCRPNGRE